MYIKVQLKSILKLCNIYRMFKVSRHAHTELNLLYWDLQTFTDFLTTFH